MANQENRPCPGCRSLGQKCSDDCILGPQNDSEKLEKPALVDGPDKFFTLLPTIPESNRTDAVDSLHEEENSSSVDRPPCLGCRSHGQKCGDDCILAKLCGDDCILATLFPQNDSEKLEKPALVDRPDKFFTLLPTIPESNRKDAVESLHEEENTSSVAWPPCAGCRFLGHKCESDCLFVPIFPQNDPQKFDNMVAKWGADAINKLLMLVLKSHHKVPVKSLHEKDLEHLSSHKVMPDNSQPMIGVSADVASIQGSSQPQQTQQRSKDKGKGKLVSGNSPWPPQLLADKSHLMPGLASVHGPPQPQQTQQMAGKRLASAVHRGKLVSGNHPQLLTDSQTTIGLPAGVASVHSPPQQKRPRQMAKDKGKQVRLAAHEDKLMIGNRSQQLLPGQQVWQMAPSANRGQQIIRDPQTHEYRAVQQQMARISSADSSQILIRQPQPHGYQRIVDQQQLHLISSVNTGQVPITEPQPHGYPRIADQQRMDQVSRVDMHQLPSREHQWYRYAWFMSPTLPSFENLLHDQRYSLLQSQQQLQRNHQPYFPHGYQDSELSWQMAQRQQNQRSQQNQQSYFPRQMVLQRQHNQQLQQNRHLQDSELSLQMSLPGQHNQQLQQNRQPQDSELSLQMALPGQQNQQLNQNRQPQDSELSLQMALPGQQNKQLQQNRQPQDSELSLQMARPGQQNQQLQQNRQPCLPPNNQDSELSLQITLPGQQNQQLQQNRRPCLPPNSELSLQMVLPGQNQQLQLHSDILSYDPRLRSQMMVQPQQHQQSHSQEQYSQPALDQQSRSRSDEGKSTIPFNQDRGS